MKINGWESIIPQLAGFFVILRRHREREQFTPFNLFLCGAPGTNKTEGALELAQGLELSAQLVDVSTIDDVSELAGVVDLQALRTHGETKMVKGDLLAADVLVADEFLNGRPHVMPQFRLVLQGYMVVFGKRMTIQNRSIVATGNLTSDMQHGSANLLDSPTADRFALVVKVPSLSDMSKVDIAAVLEGRDRGVFAKEFGKAILEAEKLYDDIERDRSDSLTAYVTAMVTQMAGSEFAFEGRRGKMLRQFVAFALALCEAQPDRDTKETIWQLTHDCLTYHRLSGIELDIAKLRAAHEVAFNQSMVEQSLESMVESEPELSEKIALIVEHRKRISPITKAAVFGDVLTSNDAALKVATLELVRSPEFADEPSELRAMIERMDLEMIAPTVPASTVNLEAISSMEPAEALLYGLAGADPEKLHRLKAEAARHLRHWAVR